MRKLLFKCIFIFISFLFSCKGGQEIITPCMNYSKPELLIKEIVTIQNGETSKSIYFYDSLNRIKRRNDSGSYYFTVIWKYTRDKVLLLRQDSSVQSYFDTDSNGYALAPSIGHFVWEYDHQGYLISQNEYWSNLGTMNDKYNYTCWNNDKITSDGTDASGNKIGGGIITNTFYLDKINTVGNENIGIKYFGKQNNCLIKSSVVTFKGNVDTLACYKFEFDSLDRVTKEIKTYGDNESVVRLFKYY